MSRPPEDTADPASAPSRRNADTREEGVVTLAFHPDLRRVGERVVLEGTEGWVVVGRDGPAFRPWLHLVPVEARPLGDPCVSRVQLRLRWLAKERAFEVEPDPSARRPLTRFDAEGRPLPLAGRAAPGELLALGDRVLLHLDVRPRARAAPIPALVGDGSAMRAVRERIHTVASSREPVLVLGETGTGKELAARAVHATSPRAQGPFVAVNCAALPESLVESELFGHAKGAFSGAAQAQPGLFREATKGTLFLDEIGELPLATQAKLLRVLDEREVRPVGASAPVAVDVRVVAATNRDLAADVEEGTFRRDLLARLSGLAVELPPLRARREDVPVLFAHLLLAAIADTEGAGVLVRDADTFAPPVPLSHVLGLLGRPYRANVRELRKHALGVALASARRGAFASGEPDGGSRSSAEAPAGRPDRAELERLLEAHDFVAQRVAAELGVSRATVLRWLTEAAIARPADLSAEDIARAMREAQGDLDAAARMLRVSARGLKLRMR